MSIAPVNQKNSQALTHDEIDLRQVFDCLCRRWQWIIGGGGLGLAFAGLQLLTTKPVFQAEFQIVLNNRNSQSRAAALLSQNAALATIAGLSSTGSNDSIATEVQILNSPSVLKPVFDAVKARKSSQEAATMRFQDWAKSSINAEEEKGTSVLTVKYRDTDKDQVLPTTTLISKAYQSYSNRGRARELANVIQYLKEQINHIKPKANAKPSRS